MRHRLLAAPLAALLLAAAPPPAPAGVYKAPAAQAERVRATVEFLADDLLEGRAAGKRGHEVAAVYLASRYRALGLEPAGENGSWYQRVPFRRAATAGTPTFALTSGGRTEALAANRDIAIRPSVTERERKMAAELLFVGYGLREPKLRLDDYAGLDARGKIVVVLSGTPRGLPSDIAAHLSQQKDEMAAAAGAVGLIEIGGGNPSDREVTDWVDSRGAAGNVPAGLRLRGSVSRGVAERLFAGKPQSLAAILQQRAAGQPVRGFPLGARLSLDARSNWTDFTSPAVIGRLPGSDPVLAKQNVLLMGHLDHLGMKENAKPGEDAIYNGALDNAAGVATMLEAAQRFVDSGQRPRRSLLLIAHTGEELGLLGASYWASHATVPLSSVTAAIDLDMPLPLYDFTDVTAFGAEHSTIADTVAAAGRTMGISVGPDPMPEQGIFTRSDHYPLVLKGVPAILMFTGHANGGKPVWDRFFSDAYHRAGDDLKQDINWGALARYGELNYRIARTLADSPQRATWKPGSYFAKAVR
ncbi:M20/M25/M40 family metallo-hydrolase [Sphingomonas swuensis]|uniref:M20/M25/M40 family metallo-hydrolase n=1 Tax=Sphingomonas swuensis TaxID=977800 RepID=A0ABP7TDI3_9SPHN